MMSAFPATIEKLDQPAIAAVLFHPRQEPRSPLPSACEDLDIVTTDNSAMLGCRVHTADKAAPTIIFFHGNGETVGDYDDVGPSFIEVGLNVVFASYRGYGWSSGTPTAATLFADADVVFTKVTDWCNDNGYTGPIFVMGRSLGSVSAIDVAKRLPGAIRGLIIESGFADTIPLLETLGCACTELAITEQDCFLNRSKIATIELPTLILHGARDEIIKLTEAELLHVESGAKNKQFQIVPGAGHNSLMAVAGKHYFLTIKQFIDGVTGANSWRERRKRFKKEARS